MDRYETTYHMIIPVLRSDIIYYTRIYLPILCLPNHLSLHPFPSSLSLIMVTVTLER
jgi:hypothetical protein